jgi:hypothetical protein
VQPGHIVSRVRVCLNYWYVMLPLLYVYFVCTWAQDERPADLHMAQPNVPVSKTGHIPPARLFRGGRAMPGTGRQRLISLSGCQLLHLTSTHARYLKHAGRPHSCYDRQACGEHLMQSEVVCHVCLMLPGKPGLRNLQSAIYRQYPHEYMYALHACMQNAD